MKDIQRIINETVVRGGRNYVRDAVNRILEGEVKVGSDVAVVDDPVSGMHGAKGKVRSISDSNPGFAEVELENGTKVQMQTSLLVTL